MRIVRRLAVYMDMTLSVRRFTLAFLALVLSTAAWAQTFVVHHNANLRRNASTQSAIVAELEPGDELAAISSTQRNGFWHVRTESGDEGWIYRTLVHREEEDDDLPVIPPATDAAASGIDEDWEKPAPTGSVLQGPPGMGTCPARGEDGGDYETNTRKNRIDVPSSYHAVSFDAMMALPDNSGASNNRRHWSQAQKDVVVPFEGIPVSVVGYVNRVKKQFGSGEGGESTNCHFFREGFVDIHVALVESFGDGERTALVVEPTPRFYKNRPTWIWTKMKALEFSTDPVRISGLTLFDPSHRGHMGTYRASMWEIHPITKIEVFKNGQWVVW